VSVESRRSALTRPQCKSPGTFHPLRTVGQAFTFQCQFRPLGLHFEWDRARLDSKNPGLQSYPIAALRASTLAEENGRLGEGGWLRWRIAPLGRAHSRPGISYQVPNCNRDNRTHAHCRACSAHRSANKTTSTATRPDPSFFAFFYLSPFLCSPSSAGNISRGSNLSHGWPLNRRGPPHVRCRRCTFLAP
jgi:hypothetical protein